MNTITETTTAKDIVDMKLTPNELEHAIILYAKYRHKRVRHDAIDIVLDAKLDDFDDIQFKIMNMPFKD